MLYWWIYFLQTHSLSLYKTLTDGLELCGLLVDYCDVFISYLDSHSDGTHSLQRIHWWASDVMLLFSKSVQMKMAFFLNCTRWNRIKIQTMTFAVGLLKNNKTLTLWALWWAPHAALNLTVTIKMLLFRVQLSLTAGERWELHDNNPVHKHQPHTTQHSPTLN